MNNAPHLVTFLQTTQKDLIDSFTICANLTVDLQNVEYHPDTSDESSSSSSSSEGEQETVKRPRPSRPSKATGDSVKKGSSKTLKELEEASDIDDGSVQAGFVDEKSGEVVYIIEKVIKYEPKHGYFVHWKGYPKSDRSWQRPEDMPSGLTKEMKQARDRYKDSTLHPSARLDSLM